uniref:Uncharacterized protein n=1 Tax=Rhodosorus marinus TaxID=101924 RepID=A0A7S3AD97_9RHOD|mmetsp:Transcript_926/g.2359  ORF Transcript_926/g.2359 Transcript_926/m.2359 type:complete len:130 (+) Transcript_926:84-473(+)
MVLGFLVSGVAGGGCRGRVSEVEGRRLRYGTVMRGVVQRGYIREVGPEETGRAEEKEEDDDWCFGEESVEKAIEAIRAGRCVVVTDDKDRENEGGVFLVGIRVWFWSLALAGRKDGVRVFGFGSCWRGM